MKDLTPDELAELGRKLNELWSKPVSSDRVIWLINSGNVSAEPWYKDYDSLYLDVPERKHWLRRAWDWLWQFARKAARND